MADQNREYQPISCAYYDELEALATLGRKSTIQYHDLEGNATTVEGVIKDFYVENKVEYMTLDDGRDIRLDKLIAVNGKPMAS